MDNTSIGRYQLSKILGISKAQTRKVLEFIKENDWAVSNRGRGGTKLIRTGKQCVDTLKQQIYLDFDNNCYIGNMIEPYQNSEYMICLLRASNLSTDGLYERDLAVREGAKGAITLICTDNNWYFAGDEKVEAEFQPPENIDYEYNMAIIGFGSSTDVATRGAINGSYYHLENKIKQILEEYLSR